MERNLNGQNAGQTNRLIKPLIELLFAILRNSMSSLMFYCPKVSIFAIFEKRVTDGPTDGPTDRPTDGRTKPLIEMRGRI